jgi:hypothetical protein
VTTSLDASFLAQLQAAFPPSRRAALDRIALRAQADAPHALATIGTGAPSTAKRAAALQMALSGENIPAIAAAVHLSEARVAQLLENVLYSGLPALYPTFVEEVPLPDGMTGPIFWKILRPLLESSPSSHKIRAGKWNPAFLLELLITQGTLEDLSNSRLAEIIRFYIDPEMAKNSFRFEYVDSGHTPPGAKNSIWPNVFALAIVLLIFALGISQGIHLMAFIGGFFTFFFGFSLIKSLLEIRLLRRVLAHNKKHAAVPSASPLQPVEPPHPSIPNSAPPPPITILHAADLPSVQWNLDLLTDTSNAIGQPRRSILYLWVFAAQNDQGGFETQGWPQVGPVHLLLNATALTLGKLMGNLDKLLVSDQPTLDATIAAYDDRVGTYPRPMLFVMGALGKYNYRGYPIHTLVCNDAVWKPPSINSPPAAISPSSTSPASTPATQASNTRFSISSPAARLANSSSSMSATPTPTPSSPACSNLVAPRIPARRHAGAPLHSRPRLPECRLLRTVQASRLGSSYSDGQ